MQFGGKSNSGLLHTCKHAIPVPCRNFQSASLKLSRTVTFEQRRRLVCIPDLTSAQSEREKLQRQHGPAMTDARISKNGKGKDATWTVSYTLRESRTEELF